MKFILTILFFAISQLSFGWGQTGHRVVGQIAQNHLSKKAKKNIQKILGTETLAYASTYMDEIKSEASFKYANDWHWVTIPDGSTYSNSEKNNNGDVVEAIDRMTAILKSDTANLNQRKQALRFLVHLVGDIHQPLHVGNGTDKGGNNVKVKWFGESSNLHRVWDSEMIDSRGWSFSELAQQIDVADKTQILGFQNSLNPANWAEEAMQYRPQIYNTGDTERMGYRYTYDNWSLLEEQLLKGGLRLAGLLNEIFG